MRRNGSGAAGDRRGGALLVAVLLAGAAPAGAASTVPSERDLTLTIYRQDAALIQDRREIPREARGQQLTWPDVAPTLQADTVRLSGAGGGLHGYRVRHEPVSMAGLLEAYLDRTVGIEQDRNRGTAVTEATLLSADPPMVEVDGEVQSVDPDTLVFPDGMPPRMGAAPALELELARGGPSDDTASDERRATLSYLASGFSWSADYVATISADGRRMDLVARARITNRSGMDVTEARAELIAGQPVFPQSSPEPRPVRMMRESADMARAAGTSEPLGHLQRFRLDAAVTLADGERYSRRLFEHRGIAVERTQVLRSSAPVAPAGNEAGWRAIPLRTEIAWTSAAALPAGVVRVHRDTGAGPARFVGGARIPDRPPRQPVAIEPGQPFDVTARRRQTAYERLGERSYAVAHAIELHNGGQTPAVVRIEEQIPGDWRITDASGSWEQVAAQLAVWRVELAPGATHELRYRARIAR